MKREDVVYDAASPAALPEDPPPHVLLELERSDGAKFIVAVKTYRGHRYVDLRLHERGADGAWWPTRKGATVKLRELRAVTGAPVAAQRMTGDDGGDTADPRSDWLKKFHDKQDRGGRR